MPLPDVRADERAAFAPGHVSGFFRIYDQAPDVSQRGSVGAGFCLEQGAASWLRIAPAESLQIEVHLDGDLHDAPVTREALMHIIKCGVRDARIPLNQDAAKGEKARVRVEVATRHDLPLQHGFGMSAAGALAAATALAKMLRVGRSEALVAAHRADILHQGGLGDVMGAHAGGFEMRLAAGLPPHGAARHFLGVDQVVVCALEGDLATRDILGDATLRAKIDAEGQKAIERFVVEPQLNNFVQASRAFAQATGLMDAATAKAVEACRPYGEASMCMLGRSVFAFGDAKRLVDTLGAFGDTRLMGIDEHGPRMAELKQPE